MSETAGLLPKALIALEGQTLLQRQLGLLARQGVRRVAIIAGHLAERLESAGLAEAAALGIECSVLVEDEPRGTAGSLGLCASFLGEQPFFLIYGDMALDLDFGQLGQEHFRRRPLATIVVHPNDHPGTSDIVLVDDGGEVQRIVLRGQEDRPRWLPNCVPAGVYVFEPGIMRHLPKRGKVDFIVDLFPMLIAKGLSPRAYDTAEYLRDIGTPERLALVRDDFRRGRPVRLRRSTPRQAIFFASNSLLSDQVAENRATGAGALALEATAADAVKLANDAELLAFALAEPPRLAQATGTADARKQACFRLETLLGDRGAWLDRIYACSEALEEPAQVEQTGPRSHDVSEIHLEQIARARTEFSIDLARSVAISDSSRQVAAARQAGLWSYGLRSGAGCRAAGQHLAPHLMFEHASKAVRFSVYYGQRYGGLAQRLVQQVRQQASPEHAPFVVAICGRMRCGKSTLAHALHRLLAEGGYDVVPVSLDQWILPLPERNRGMSPLEICQVARYPELYQQIRARRSIESPGYDPQTRQQAPGTTYDFRSCAVVLIDGQLSSWHPARGAVDYAIYIEASEAVIERRHRSFYRWKGLDPEQISQHLAHQRVREWPLIAQQRARASETWQAEVSEC
jgi:dTDP-glucose pyrophosphorylase/uridine kinase